MKAEAFLEHSSEKISETIDKIISNRNFSEGDMLLLKKEIRSRIFVVESRIYPFLSQKGKERLRGFEVEHAGMLQMLDKIRWYIERNMPDKVIDRLTSLKKFIHIHNEIEIGFLNNPDATGILTKTIELEPDVFYLSPPEVWMPKYNIARKR